MLKNNQSVHNLFGGMIKFFKGGNLGGTGNSLSVSYSIILVNGVLGKVVA